MWFALPIPYTVLFWLTNQMIETLFTGEELKLWGFLLVLWSFLWESCMSRKSFPCQPVFCSSFTVSLRPYKPEGPLRGKGPPAPFTPVLPQPCLNLAVSKVTLWLWSNWENPFLPFFFYRLPQFKLKLVTQLLRSTRSLPITWGNTSMHMGVFSKFCPQLAIKAIWGQNMQGALEVCRGQITILSKKWFGFNSQTWAEVSMEDVKIDPCLNCTLYLLD